MCPDVGTQQALVLDHGGPHRVVALAIPSVVAFDLSVPAQIFGHRDQRDRYSFTVCTLHPGRVPTSSGFTINVERGLDALEEADTVVVPGFSPLDHLDGATADALRRSVDRGARVASVCVGAFALAMAGLLDGRLATTHWEWADEFRRRFTAVHLDPDVLYVDAGQVLTSAGITAGIDLCLYLVGQDYGEQVAAAVASRMVVATHRTGGQLQHARRPVPVEGGLGPTRDWALSQLDRPLGVANLARHAGMSIRSFTRHFRAEIGLSPMAWLTAERVREAQRLLEATALSVEDVAARSGFGTATTLRVQLARAVGTTPTAYRHAHRTRLDGAG